MKKIHILVVEDNRLLRESIAALLDKQADMRVAAAIDDGDAVLSALNRLPVSVVLLDPGADHEERLHLVRAIKKSRPDVCIVMMDLIELYAEIYEFAKAGVSGFIVKDARSRDFLQTIRSVFVGGRVLPPSMEKSLFSKIVDHAGRLSLPAVFAEAVRTTKRQRQVIELIASGLTNKEIARRLHLSPYTVKSHVHNILEKLSLHTRVQIANRVHTANPYSAVMSAMTLMKN
ncbi:MAG: response regulator transcription factor [Acidobacteriota bacterium]